MKRRDRKLAILRQLSLESEPITLYELANAFELNYSNRTIRRLLNELIEEGFVKRYGSTKGAKYVAVKATDRILNQEPIIPSQDINHISSCFGSESLNAIEKINKPLFERQPVTYNSDWLRVTDSLVSGRQAVVVLDATKNRQRDQFAAGWRPLE